jgi:hypothetical protein
MSELGIVAPRERPPEMITDVTLRLTWREFEWMDRLVRFHIGKNTEESIRAWQLLAIMRPDDGHTVRVAAGLERTFGALNDIPDDPQALPEAPRPRRRRTA